MCMNIIHNQGVSCLAPMGHEMPGNLPIPVGHILANVETPQETSVYFSHFNMDKKKLIHPYPIQPN